MCYFVLLLGSLRAIQPASALESLKDVSPATYLRYPTTDRLAPVNSTAFIRPQRRYSGAECVHVPIHGSPGCRRILYLRRFGKSTEREEWIGIGSKVTKKSHHRAFIAIVRALPLPSFQFLLTAAHCVTTDASPKKWLVVTYTLDLTKGNPAAIVYPVTRIYAHPSYDDYFLENDAAIFKLGNAFGHDGTYQPAFVEINLDESFPAVGDSLRAIGWGATAWRGSASVSQLLQVDLPFLSRDRCMTVNWGNGPYGPWVNYPSMLCAGEKGKDSC
jgi:hypothetical protein